MTSKYTPGPWVVSSGMVETSTGIPIAHMDRNPGNGTFPVERDTNARLIAAAPEMAEALHKLITLQAYMNWPDAPAWKEAISALEKAGVIDSPIKKYADFCNRIQEQQRKESDK